MVEVNARVGSGGDADGERSMSIGLAPSRRWMEFHPEECRHVQSIEHMSYGGEEWWQCPCGRKFAPLTPDV